MRNWEPFTPILTIETNAKGVEFLGPEMVPTTKVVLFQVAVEVEF